MVSFPWFLMLAVAFFPFIVVLLLIFGLTSIACDKIVRSIPPEKTEQLEAMMHHLALTSFICGLMGGAIFIFHPTTNVSMFFGMMAFGTGEVARGIFRKTDIAAKNIPLIRQRFSSGVLLGGLTITLFVIAFTFKLLDSIR